MTEKQANRTLNGISSKAERLFPLDALRGLIMVLMALDHANHFVAQQHSSGEYWVGSFPIYHDALTFLTRFVTHLAAPGFFFLMSAGIVMFADTRRKRGWSEWEIIRHFLVRGLMLIALQLLVVNRVWELSPGGWAVNIYIGVLFALGGAMILSSLLLWLEPKYLLILTIVLALGTELLVPDMSLWGPTGITNPADVLNPLLVQPGGIAGLWSNYPVLPWLELVTFGMFFGYWLLDDKKKAYNRAIILGAAFLVTFFVIRYFDGFGNLRPREGDTWIDFLNVVKYPPSIAFNLLAMGVNLILLGLFARLRQNRQRFFRPLVVFGQVPLFFYLNHLFLYAGLGWLLTPNGTSIPAMYPFWVLGLLILYPLCLWFGRLKHKQPANSILRFI